MESIKTILWRGLVFPGHESCSLLSRDREWHLQGTAVFSHEQRPCHLSYHIVCDEAWQTRSAHVQGWLGKTFIDIQIKADEAGWCLNDVEQPDGMAGPERYIEAQLWDDMPLKEYPGIRCSLTGSRAGE